MATQERNRVDNFSQTAIGCMRFIGFCSPTASPEQQCCGDRGCSECIGYQTCSRNFSSNIATKIATTTTNVTATIPIDIITKSFMFNNNTTVSKNDTSTLLSTTNLSTTIGATMKSNDTTIGETAVMVLGTEPPPVWIFGVAGGGVVALLLLIGAVALACWCNKRAQPNSAQIVMSSNDTNMSSFRESSSMKEQRSNQYAALSSVPSNEYGAAPVVASNYASPSNVVVPHPMQHYDEFTNVQSLSQYDDVPIRSNSAAQYEPAPTKRTTN